MTGYALRLSEAERDRYKLMADRARADEGEMWALAGIAPGARIVDLGCGPGATLVAMAEVVGAEGSVLGIDGDPDAVEAANELIKASAPDNATAQVGDAAATGLEPGSFDVAVFRHVLAHNRPTEQDLVAHAASLVRPGGAVYLVDVDFTMVRMDPEVPEILEMRDRYLAFHAARGNDLQVGLRLGRLLTGAGLDVTGFEGRISVLAMPAGMRSPAWAARDAMLAGGFVTAEQVAGWGAYFAAADASPTRPIGFIPTLFAVGRKPA